MKNEHVIKCVNCGGDIDCRDLSQVFHHEGDCLITSEVTDIPFSKSKKVGGNQEYTKGGITLPLN